MLASGARMTSNQQAPISQPEIRRYIGDRIQRTDLRMILLLVLATVAVFLPVLDAGFVAWDDNILIYRNPYLAGLSAQTVKWAFTGVDYVLRYQPLTWLTWFAIYDLFGLEPFGFHLVNFLLHCANVVLVFLLIRNLLLLTQRTELPTTER